MALLDLLSCKFNATSVALPLSRVIGVVEGGPLTPLPFCADAFEGLVEAIGQIVPQIDLAAILGQTQPAGGILIVVGDANGALALRVQQVSSMIQAELDAALENGQADREEHPLFKGSFQVGDERVYLLDLDLLAQSDKVDAVASRGEVLLATTFEQAASEPVHAEEATSFLLVDVGGEQYAFESGSVLELNAPGAIRYMPGAPPWVLGLIDLRGAPVLALSTAALLGKPVSSGRETCLIAELESGPQVALFIDRAAGLERFATDLVHDMKEPMAGICQYLVREADRIVGVIDPVQLIAQVETQIRAIAPEVDVVTARGDAAFQEAEQLMQVLTVRLGTETFGVALERVTRIQASVRLTPLPAYLQHFDGVADVGEQMVPVVDLRKQASSYVHGSRLAIDPPCLLATLEGAMTGVIVDQVLAIREFPLSRFEPVKDAAKLPITHVVNAEGRLVAMLELDRIFPAADAAR
jgi:chemotaxis signal transduction protein